MGAEAEELLPARRHVRFALRSAAQRRARAGMTLGSGGASPEVEELNRAVEALRRCISRRNEATPPQEIPLLFRIASPITSEEARAQLEEIMRRRKRVLEPDEVYTIPVDQLRFKGTLGAEGPSLVEGDYPVRFDYFEQVPDKPKRHLYGPEGSKAGKDMRLVSIPLYKRIHECLRLLPEYTETCVKTGKPIRQPLQVIANKLLRGEIPTIDKIRFGNLSPEGKRLVRREEAQKKVPSSRKQNRTSLPREAEALLKDGHAPASAAKTLERMFPKAGSEATEAALRTAQERLEPQ